MADHSNADSICNNSERDIGGRIFDGLSSVITGGSALIQGAGGRSIAVKGAFLSVVFEFKDIAEAEGFREQTREIYGAIGNVGGSIVGGGVYGAGLGGREFNP